MPADALTWLAAAIAALTFLTHTFAGGAAVARPLLKDASLPPAAKWLSYYCWHIVTVMLAFMAGGFVWLALNPYAPGTIFLTSLAVVCAILSAAVAMKGKIHPLRLPSTSLFTAIAASGAASLF